MYVEWKEKEKTEIRLENRIKRIKNRKKDCNKEIIEFKTDKKNAKQKSIFMGRLINWITRMEFHPC